jgi:RND family efflux transporter MFP subunit
METKNADLSSLRIDRKETLKNPDLKYRPFKIMAYTTIAIIVLVSLYIGWKSLTDQALEVKLTPAVIQSPAQSNAVLTASGYVVAQRKAAVASKGTGRLVYLRVVEGDKVTKDEIIARIEDSDIKAQLEQAKANLSLNQAVLSDAEKTLQRQKTLTERNLGTQADLDAAEANYNKVVASIAVAVALVHQSEVALENTLIRAPFNGTVLTKDADIGEVVAPFGAGANSKAAVVTIADMSSLEGEIDVSESNIEKILLNQECEIRLDAYPDHAYPGYVAKIVPTADRGKATVMVKVGFKTLDSRVLPEMSAKVVFLNESTKKISIDDTKQLLIIPASSVAKRNNRQVAFVVRDDKAVEIPVVTGEQFGAYVEIKSGLSTGDKVIEPADDKIKDGIKVRTK